MEKWTEALAPEELRTRVDSVRANHWLDLQTDYNLAEARRTQQRNPAA